MEQEVDCLLVASYSFRTTTFTMVRILLQCEFAFQSFCSISDSLSGIDLIAGGRKCGHKTREAPKSDNIYLALLVKVGRRVGILADA